MDILDFRNLVEAALLDTPLSRCERDGVLDVATDAALRYAEDFTNSIFEATRKDRTSC